MKPPVRPGPWPLAAAVAALAGALVAVPFGGLAALPLPGGAVTPAAPLVALGLLVMAWRRPGLRLGPGVGALLVGLGLYLAALAASTWAAADFGVAVLDAARWVEFTLAFALAYAVASTTVGRRWALAAALTAGAMEAALGAAMAWRGVGPEAFAILGGRLARAFGHFGQPNPFGGYMNMVWPLGAAVALGALHGAPRRRGQVRDGGRRQDGRHDGDQGPGGGHDRGPAGGQGVPAALGLAGLACAAVAGAAVILSWSRGAWLAAAAAAAVMAGLWVGPRLRPPWTYRGVVVTFMAVAVVLAGASVASPGVVPASVLGRAGSIGSTFVVWDVTDAEITDANYATVERVAHWQAAVAMWAARPWLGQGPGHYPVAYAAFRLPRWSDPLGHAHNYYLNALAETGIVGLAAYLLFLAAAFRLVVVTAWRRTGTLAGATALGVSGVLTATAVHNLVDNMYVHDMALQLGLLMGLAAAPGAMAPPVAARGTFAPGHRAEGHASAAVAS